MSHKSLLSTTVSVIALFFGSAQGKTGDPIRVAVFDLADRTGAGENGKTAADMIAEMLTAVENLQLVNRTDLDKVASEHKLAISGLADPIQAVRIGKLVNAQFIVTGSINRVGQKMYIIVKITEVETTIQQVVSSKVDLESGVDGALQQLAAPLVAKLSTLRRTAESHDERMDALKERISPARGKRVVVSFDEEHLTRRLRDPAVITEITSILTDLGLVVLHPPTVAVQGWQDELRRTGRLFDKRVDLFLTGEGISEYATRFEDLVSCRARVELKLIQLPGDVVVAAEAAHASGVDLTEAMAAKSALTQAAREAAIEVLSRWVDGFDR